jgi:hypothetical protein
MKIQFRTSRFITGVTVVCALAIATTAFAKKPKKVELKISNNQLIITTKHNENDCKWKLLETREDGCIELIKNETSKIYFYLKGDTKCGLESGTDWKLNAVYLGGFDFEDKPTDTEGFGFANTPDPDYDKVKSDFNIANRTSGLVTPAEEITDKKIAIDDKNGYKNAYHVWYKIEAICERADGKPAHTTSSDPRVKNGGND